MQEMKKVLLMECISITTFLQFLEVLYDVIYIYILRIKNISIFQ